MAWSVRTRVLIANSYALGMVSGQSLVGELVGNNSGTIRYSYGVGSLDLVGSDLDGTISTSSVVADLAELATSIDRNVWDANAWSFEDGKYPALRYITSAGCENDSSCGQLLGGQYPRLVSLTIGDPPGDPEASLLRINPLNYELRTGNMVMLTPTASDDTVLLSYSIDGGNFTDIANGSSFTISGANQTATIRLSIPSAHPSAEFLRTVDYIVLVDPIIRDIEIQVRVLLEGLLNEPSP